jgi:hypothetical protein
VLYCLRSFDWYVPRQSVLESWVVGPSARHGHVAAIYGEKMFVYGGQTLANQGERVYE